MAKLKDGIDDVVVADENSEHCITTVHDVINALSRLKPGKHDGYLGFVLGSCQDLASSTVLPIPKGKNLN